MNRMTRLGSVGLLLGATILIAASQADAQRRPTRRPRGPQLKVGQVAPKIELSPLTFKTNDKGETVGVIGMKKIKLATFKGKAPVVIFSSSYTWPPFRRVAPAVETLYKAYKGKAQFFLVYTREIHPSANKTSPPRRPGGPAGITQHTSIKERMIAADKCMKGLKLTLPFLLDTMDNAFLKAYGGIPAGTAVIDINGKIAYWNPGAPTGCKPKNAEETLKKLLAAGGGAIGEKWAPVKIPQDKPRKDPPKPPAKRPIIK